MTMKWATEIVSGVVYVTNSAGLEPSPPEHKTWSLATYLALQVGIAINIPAYMIGSSLFSLGLNPAQSLLVVLLANIVVVIPMCANSHAGTQYGIPFPVLLRPVFGYAGAKVVALLRSFFAICWFGIQTWLGGKSLYLACVAVLPSAKNAPYLGGFIGINLLELVCFFLFWGMNVVLMLKGTICVEIMQNIGSPVLIVASLALFIWAWAAVGSFSEIIEEMSIISANYTSSGNNTNTGDSTPQYTTSQGMWLAVSAILGNSSTLALTNVDFARFARTNWEQMVGTSVGYVLPMVCIAFVGMFVTAATSILYSEIIWDPVDLVVGWDSVPMSIFSFILVAIATITTNISANVVSPAYAIVNIAPDKISYTTASMIIAILGALFMPWKLISTPGNYMLRFLSSAGAVLGGVLGILICDYYVVRRMSLNIPDLYENCRSTFGNFRAEGFIAFFVALVLVLPGTLHRVLDVPVAMGWQHMYEHGWTLTFFLGFGLYWLMNVLSRVLFDYRKQSLESTHLLSGSQP